MKFFAALVFGQETEFWSLAFWHWGFSTATEWVDAGRNVVENGKQIKRGCMNWLECEEIEAVPGKMGGVPVVKGTRVEPDTILTDFELGSPVEEIHDNFPTVPVATIRRLIAFAHQRQPVP